MLQEGIYADSRQKENELLAIIHEECVRLIGAVNRILDLSRMEANMMTYHFSDYGLESLIQKSVFKLDPIAKSKNVRLEYLPERNLPLVSIDERRIEQVLENLLGNALKFTSNNDSVTIQATVKNGRGKFVEVAISDTGPGIAEKDLEKIFDKFQRIENGKETVRGTGLGLPIAKHIIAAHGGRIWVKNESKQGSTFCFTLPVSEPS
jgi:two-component system sensor histidine kinase GlrK